MDKGFWEDLGELFWLVVLIGVPLIGYVLNFQNLWQYWPEGGKLINLSLYWIISIVGVIFPPLGSITGWIW